MRKSKKQITISLATATVILIIMTIIASCKKSETTTNSAPEPLYLSGELLRYHTSTDDRLHCSGLYGPCSFPTQPPSKNYNYILSTDEIQGTATATLMGSDTVKISKIFDKMNLSQSAYDKIFTQSGYMNYNLPSGERDDILNELYYRYKISGFPDKIIIPAGDILVNIVGGIKPQNNKFKYIENIYFAKNGEGRREIIIQPY